MKTIYRILIIIGILLILGVIFLFSYGKITNKVTSDEEASCNYWNRENCDFSCNVDTDCGPSAACFCLNKNEEIFMYGNVNSCVVSNCKCTNGECLTCYNGNCWRPDRCWNGTICEAPY